MKIHMYAIIYFLGSWQAFNIVVGSVLTIHVSLSSPMQLRESEAELRQMYKVNACFVRSCGTVPFCIDMWRDFGFLSDYNSLLVYLGPWWSTCHREPIHTPAGCYYCARWKRAWSGRPGLLWWWWCGVRGDHARAIAGGAWKWLRLACGARRFACAWRCCCSPPWPIAQIGSDALGSEEFASCNQKTHI